MKPTVKVLCLSRALSPITHQSGTVGNESVLNSEPVRTSLGVRQVPMLSGNAIRHRLVRSPAALQLVEAWQLAGALTKDELNLLFHGGLRREASNRVSLTRTAEMERLFPMLRLLGCCLPDDIYPGSLYARRGILVCRENESRVRTFAPAGWCPESMHLAPATTFVQRWQYVRGEARQSQRQLKPSDSAAIDADEKGGGSDMMPFAGTAVLAGAEFLHGFVVRHADELALGCLFAALERWQDDGATIGGMGSRGHGVLGLSLHVDGVDIAACTAAYRQHVAENMDAGVAMLRSLYAPATKRPAKKQQKALVAAEANGEDGE